MHRCQVVLRQIRPYYNLPSKSETGRRMTGFLTPYRHWMWKQNELWRNVHEAQFEHLRRVYKRQWLESFRVNADEYIYKYNITKAAQLAQWEYEMQAQEKKRRESQQMAHGRQALKKKHLDLLREFHERQFFYWYERASERLQYMTHIAYVQQSDLQDHIDRELDKYVAGATAAYRLNFAGQMPMLEDRDGNVVQVPANLMTNYATETGDASATVYEPPEGTTQAEERLLQVMASAQEETLPLHPPEDEAEAAAAALSETDETLARDEDTRDAEAKVARSMEESEAEREVSRRAYIDRGKIGAKTIFRRPRFEDETPGAAATTAAGGGGAPDSGPALRRRKSKLDRAHALQAQEDVIIKRATAEAMRRNAEALAASAAAGGGSGDKEGASKSVLDLPTEPKRGEIAQKTGHVRLRSISPTAEQMRRERPDLIDHGDYKSRVRTQNLVDKRFKRGKYKESSDGKPNQGGSGNDSEDL